MDKYKDNTFVEEMDAIVLLNDNYIEKGLKTGYIGVVMDNLLKNSGLLLQNFSIHLQAMIYSLLLKLRKRILE